MLLLPTPAQEATLVSTATYRLYMTKKRRSTLENRHRDQNSNVAVRLSPNRPSPTVFAIMATYRLRTYGDGPRGAWQVTNGRELA